MAAGLPLFSARRQPIRSVVDGPKLDADDDPGRTLARRKVDLTSFGGLYQGVLLVTHRLASPLLERIEPSHRVDRAWWAAVRIVVTFHLICLGWLIFRADSLHQAAGMLAVIFQRPALPPAAYLVPVALAIIPLFLVQFFQYLADDLDVIGHTPCGMSEASFIPPVFMPSSWGGHSLGARRSSSIFSFSSIGTWD